MDIEDMTDKQLEYELAKRKEARQRAAEQLHAEYSVKLAQHLTMDIINTLAPNHGRTSCSDSNYANGWGSADYGARCTRCALIDSMHGYTEPGFIFEIGIRRTAND